MSCRLFFVSAILILLLSCNNGVQEDDYILHHVKKYNEYLRKRTSNDLRSTIAEISNCPTSDEILNLKNTLNELRLNTASTIDSIIADSSKSQIVKHYREYEQYLLKIDPAFTLEQDVLNYDNKTNFEIAKFIVTNNLLMKELSMRHELLKLWAIDC